MSGMKYMTEDQIQSAAASVPNDWISSNTDWINVWVDGVQTAVRYDIFVDTLFKQMAIPLMKLHAALGVASEGGELADVIKREIIYESTKDHEGKPIREGLVEELGDLEFYMQAVRRMYNIPRNEVLQFNAMKLGRRYVGLVYTDKSAQDRADKNAYKNS